MTLLDWSPVQTTLFSYGGVVVGIAIFVALLAFWFNSIMPTFPDAPISQELFSSAARWVQGKKWLLKGRAMLVDAHVPGKTYMLPTPKNYCVFISSEKNVKEFASSPNFSLNKAYDDLFSYRYNKIWYDEEESIHTTQVYFFRVLRESLTTKLPDIYPHMQETLKKEINKYLANTKAVEGWKPICHYPFLEYITVSVIGPIYWGESLWANPEFQDAARKFPIQYFQFGEIVQHIPSFAVPLVKFAVTKGNKYRNILIKHLLPIVTELLAENKDAPLSEKNLPFTNVLQHTVSITRGKPYWTPRRVVLLLEALWQSGGHSVPMTLAQTVNTLCEYPQYTEPLREELGQHTEMDLKTLESLPLLNSFLKEVLRTKPLDSASTRRKLLEAHTFKDGPHVPAGNIVCIPSYSIMHDPKLYPNPEVFDGFRFTKLADLDFMEKGAAKQIIKSKVTDVDLSFPFWGYGKEACPGRFFASFEMKSVMALMLSQYDFKLADEKKPTTWSWRTFALPRKDTVLLIRPRFHSQ